MIEWSFGAQDQLFAARISFTSQTALEQFESELEKVLEQLETFPESAGMNRALYREDVRSLMVKDYRLTVLLLEDKIVVFSLVHARSSAAFD
jgi:mRNA-degrading endonuclease RelE of RelBE toxin-antitoxin system